MEQSVMHNLADSASLAGLLPADSIANAETLREVPASEIFGAQSLLVEQAPVVAESRTLIGDWMFQLPAVVMLAVVIIFIARHKRQIAKMLGRMLRGRLPEDYMAGHREEVLTNSFLHASSVIGVMSVALLLMKYAHEWIPVSFGVPAQWMVATAAGLTIAGVLAITLFEQLVLRLVGVVTRQAEIVGVLLYIKRAYFALATIAIMPLFMLGILSARNISDGWNIALLVECAILVLLFMKETLALFIDKKIPIFHWILYLCAVEAFPLSLIWALIVRS